VNVESDEIGIDVSDVNLGTLSKAFKFATRTRLKVGKKHPKISANFSNSHLFPGRPSLLLQQNPVKIEACRFHNDDLAVWQYKFPDARIPNGPNETSQLYEHKRMIF
jgi:hypothetical protein